MRSREDLQNTLRRIDGRGYKAYQDIAGEYDFGAYGLIVDSVQGDPFAAPSRMRVRLKPAAAGFPQATFSGRIRTIALRDFLTRRFFEAVRCCARPFRGAGKSGEFGVDRCGQEILERSSVLVSGKGVEARFTMGLPAYGRKIAARHAMGMFFEDLPRIVRASLVHSSLDSTALRRHQNAAEDADALRTRLKDKGLVAFVADGAVLPRASGIDPRPLRKGPVVAFRSPESLRVFVDLPHGGRISGMGIPRGVTLIVGGGFHGKSTLLNALENGIDNHVPGDGRERVTVDSATVKIRAEDGRRIEKVDISPFISGLPLGRDTRGFSTEDASGSTSQAANIMEALEAGARVLLIDEDTSASNFMIRDFRMQRLVSGEREPITPFVDKVRQLFRDRGVSTVLVIGGSGDYFDVADTVVGMAEYVPLDLTADAQRIAEACPTGRDAEGGGSFGDVIERIPLAGSLDPRKGRRPVKIASRGLKTIHFGVETIDLSAVEQLVDSSQTRAVGEAILYARRFMDGNRTLRQVVDAVAADLVEQGLDVLSQKPVGDLAAFRALELAAAINRLRTLSVRQTG